MSKRFSFLTFLKDSRLAPWLFVIATLGIGTYLKILDQHLVTRHSPNGMLSFQFSRSAFDAEDIRASWIAQSAGGTPAINVAIRSLAIDFIFMLAYGGLLLLILVRGETNEELKFRKRFIGWLPWITVGLDVLENFLSILFLTELLDWTWIMRLVSSMKFISLVLCVVFMRSLLLILSGYGRRTGKVLWTFRIVVMSLIVLYLALWQSDQGQDLLVNLNNHPLGVIVFFTVVTITAFVHWHLPKFLSRNTIFIWPTSMRGWIRALFFESIKV
jgi:hypothetical protein